MLILRLPVPLLVRAFAAEVAALKVHCCNQRKPTSLQNSKWGKMDALPHGLGLGFRGDLLGGKGKRTRVKLVPEKTEKHLNCLD